MSCPLIVVFFPAGSSKMLVSANQIPFKICESARILDPISREKLVIYPLCQLLVSHATFQYYPYIFECLLTQTILFHDIIILTFWKGTVLSVM